MLHPVYLDFCRVKKIDEKGFGFLKSLYYPGDIFFHFTQIKKEEFLDKLNHMKRGDFFLYYTSRQQKDHRRKADAIWYTLADVPADLLPAFADKIIACFTDGNTNIYDLLHAFKELRACGALTGEQVDRVLASAKVKNLPTTIVPYLTPEEIIRLKVALHLNELAESGKKPFWFDDIAAL